MSQTTRTIEVAVEPFTAEAFAPFGIVLGEPQHPAEFGGPASASWMMPFEADSGVQFMYSRFKYQPMRFSVLERHFNVTQGFVPLNGSPLIMVVAPPTDRSGAGAAPAPESVRAFYLDGSTGLLMHKGTWHALDRFPVSPPHIDCVFITDRATHVELMQEKADGTKPQLTELYDFESERGVKFEIVGADAARV
jgi:ureidoglycolate lyase